MSWIDEIAIQGRKELQRNLIDQKIDMAVDVLARSGEVIGKLYAQRELFDYDKWLNGRESTPERVMEFINGR